MPVSDKSHAVTVVPMFAPIIIPIAWCSDIMLEFTKPTAMTVTALDDWIIAVTPIPSKTPLNLLSVILARTLSNLPPPNFSRLEPI